MRRICFGALAALLVWTCADLWLRVDLPGAAWLANLGFRAATGLIASLQQVDPYGHLRTVWAVLAIATWFRPAARRWFWRLTCVVVAGAQVVTIGAAVLMERALAGGIAAGLVVLGIAGELRDPDGAAAPPGSWPRRLRLTAVLGVGALCLAYPHGLVLSSPEGYAPLLAAGEWLRAGGPSLLVLFVPVAALVAVGGAGLGLRRTGPGRLAFAAGVGLAFAGLLGVLFDDGGHVLLGGLVVLGGIALGLLVPRTIGDRLPLVDPRAWPGLLLPACAIAALLFGHAYSARVFTCPATDEEPALTRVASVPEVFRVELSGDGSRALLSVRPEARLATVDLGADQSAVRRLPSPTGSTPEEPPDTPEDLAWAGGNRFFAMHSPQVPIRFDGEFVDVPVRSVLVQVDAAAGTLTNRTALPGLCWTSCIEWSPVDERLLMGCERPYGLHRWDPDTGDLEAAPEGDRLGDVESLALDPDPAADRMFAVSLWSSGYLTELRASDLSIQRRLFLGGGNYVVSYDPVTDRVFVTSYYGGRVHIVDGSTLKRLGSIGVGFGARALAVDPGRGLLLASSTYEGVITVADTATGAVLMRLPVGGHVKDIAVDSERGLAWFWSQCGLQRVDLGQLTGRAGAP